MFKLFAPKNTENTPPQVAKLAARGLRKGKQALTDEEFRKVCASVLTQAPDKA